jgi:hypothetical protein
MRTDTRRTLAELRQRVETGQPNPVKAAAPTGKDVPP